MPLFGDVAGSDFPCARLRQELFSPNDEANKKTTDLAVELGVVAANALLSELRDEKKATAEHLSSAGGEHIK